MKPRRRRRQLSDRGAPRRMRGGAARSNRHATPQTKLERGPAGPHVRWRVEGSGPAGPRSNLERAARRPIYPRHFRPQSLVPQRRAQNLSAPLRTWRTMLSLSHERISKSSETLKGESVGWRGRRRFDEAEKSKSSLRKSADVVVRPGPRRGYTAFQVRISDEGERCLHCLRGLKPQGPGATEGS